MNILNSSLIEVPSEYFEKFDLNEAQIRLGVLMNKYTINSEEHKAIAVAIEALNYVRGQNAYKFFKEYMEDLTREPTPQDVLNYEILFNTFGRQFKEE